MKKIKFRLMEISVLLLFYFLPFVCICIDTKLFQYNAELLPVILKWCVFWGVGVRLFTAGLMQISLPSYTATEIFNITEDKAFAVVRELGFANLSLGAVAVASLFIPDLRNAATVLGILFFAMASLQHLLRRNKNATERFVTITDCTIVLELLIPFLLITSAF